MGEIGSYVERKECCNALEKCGFRHSPATNSLFLGYPFVPKEYANEGVKILLSDVPFSQVSRITAVEYYRRGSPYKKVDEPAEGFRSYAEKLIEKSLERARPKNFLV